jgi:hypothetical protein
MGKWFRQKQLPATAAVQLRNGEKHPFGMLMDYVPLQNGETRLYRAVREAVPVVDAAIYKLIRMTSGVTVSCEDQRAQRELREFLRTVPVGYGQMGLNAFLDRYLDSLLVCGSAVGEKNYTFAVIIFAITAVISITGLIIYNIIDKKHAEKATASKENTRV